MTAPNTTFAPPFLNLMARYPYVAHSMFGSDNYLVNCALLATVSTILKATPDAYSLQV